MSKKPNATASILDAAGVRTNVATATEPASEEQTDKTAASVEPATSATPEQNEEGQPFILPPAPKFRVVKGGGVSVGYAFVTLTAGQVVSDDSHGEGFIQRCRDWKIELEPVL